MFVKIRICSPVGGFDDGAGPPILSVISRQAPLTRFTLIINILIITIVVINIVIILLTIILESDYRFKHRTNYKYHLTQMFGEISRHL